MSIQHLGPLDQVVQGVCHAITTGQSGYRSGEQLMSQGAAAVRYGVNRATAARAYTVLEQYGWLRRSGTASAVRWTCTRGTPVPCPLAGSSSGWPR